MKGNGKLVSLENAVKLLKNGDVIALGGNVLHRSPSSFVREIARQGLTNLEIVKTAGAYDIDLLSSVNAIKAVSVGFVGYENEFGLCPYYRKKVESGEIEVKEHACYTVITALRAAAYGVSFLPVNGLQGSSLPEQKKWATIKDPYSMNTYYAIPKIEPDWAIIHVQEVDKYGNARIYGQKFEDVLMSRAAKKVIITAERIVDSNKFEKTPELTDIPSFLVEAVVHSPRGALPASCTGYYSYDREEIETFLSLKDAESIQHYLSVRAKADRISFVSCY